MTLLDDAKQIRNDISHLREGAGRRFGRELCSRILDWVGRAEESGTTFSDACRALGVMSQRVIKWRRALGREHTPSGSARAGRAPLAMVPVSVREVPAAEVGGITFGTPNGHTISGLTLEQAIIVLRVFA